LRAEDRGSVAAQVVAAAPLLLFLVLAIVQYVVWSMASHVAQAAAARGLDQARLTGGSNQSGTVTVTQILDQLDDGSLTNRHVSITRNRQTITVRVTGTAETVIPFLHLPIHADAVGPIEQFIPGG
jgi:hypothetical protein